MKKIAIIEPPPDEVLMWIVQTYLKAFLTLASQIGHPAAVQYHFHCRYWRHHRLRRLRRLHLLHHRHLRPHFCHLRSFRHQPNHRWCFLHHHRYRHYHRCHLLF